ncbi:MAG: SAM-dependent methyltransferase, partial [Actinomycetota bacterium]|nr:SAM-dependent methyltransferase [Actinomycetota bacterium]
RQLTERLAQRIRRQGPLPFDIWMDAALYDPDDGFFAAGGGAGRSRSDFLTSPEVGGLFGTMVARWADGWWDRLGRPDPYLVVDVGAARGQLARAVLAAGPECAPALRYVLVERSAALRDAQHEALTLEPADIALGPAVAPEPDEAPEPVPGVGPLLTSLPDLPATPFAGVVVANELLDNLPFRIVERKDGGWLEIRVGVGFTEVAVPAEVRLAAEADALVGHVNVPVGARLPIQVAMTEWLADVGAVLRHGAVAVIDYAVPVEELLARGQDGWLRTYRAQRRGGSPLEAAGTQDVTADVCLEALRRGAARAGFTVVEETTQAEWLRRLGLESLAEKARTAWHARTGNDLEALKARSLVQEADALTDASGLGAHRVVILEKRQPNAASRGRPPTETER